MRLPLALLALFLLPLELAAQPVNSPINSRTSFISYTGSAIGHDFTGISNRVRGNLLLDLNNPAGSRIEILAPVESFDSGNSNRDSNMLDAVEVDRYPEVRFRSSGIAAQRWEHTAAKREGRWLVRGDLTFHGKSRTIEVPVDISVVNGVFEARGSFPLSLTDYGVRRPRLLLAPISDTIKLSFVIQSAVSH